MKILVLGGCGIQGKAILYDLSRNPNVSEVICADVFQKVFRRSESIST